MNGLYEVAGLSRQAHAKRRQAESRGSADEALVLAEVMRLRRLHPRMGGKKLYRVLQPACMGRDRFLELLACHDLQVSNGRSRRRTTYSVKSWRYANLMEGLCINGTDQVWVTDITYFFIGAECYYIVLVMDVYSRRVLGFNVEGHMRAESCDAALAMAFRLRGRKAYGWTLIHHSDRGGQYLSDIYVTRLERMEVRLSMCLTVYENTHMERLNGTIKGEYLEMYRSRGLKELKDNLAKAVKLYNRDRPHEALEWQTPEKYEALLETTPEDQRPILQLYVDPKTSQRNKVRNQLNIFDHRPGM
jgi:transposase InsO family protein